MKPTLSNRGPSTDVKPFKHVGNIIAILRFSISNLAELLKLRRVNRTFEEVVKQHIADVWYAFVKKPYIDRMYAYHKHFSCFLEPILIARQWYLTGGGRQKIKTVTDRDIVFYDFYIYFAGDVPRDMDEIYLKYLKINREFNAMLAYHGADINHPKGLLNPLVQAVSLQHFEIMKYLCEKDTIVIREALDTFKDQYTLGCIINALKKQKSRYDTTVER